MRAVKRRMIEKLYWPGFGTSLSGHADVCSLYPFHSVKNKLAKTTKFGLQYRFFQILGVRFRSTKTVRSFCRFSLAWNSEKSVPVLPGIRTYTVRYDYGALLYFSMLVGKPTTVFIASSTNTNFQIL